MRGGWGNLCISLSRFQNLQLTIVLQTLLHLLQQKKAVAAGAGGGGGGGGGTGAATDDLQARLDQLRRGDED